eukprot:scaffold22.g6072.t1
MGTAELPLSQLFAPPAIPADGCQSRGAAPGCAAGSCSSSSSAGYPSRPAPVAAAPKRHFSGCRHCVGCGPFRHHQHTSRSAAPVASEWAEWWPSGLQSPSIYFHMRARQLELQIQRVPTSGIRLWRSGGELCGGPDSELLAQRRLPQLQLLIPAAYTNVGPGPADSYIQLLAEVRVPLRKPGGAAPQPAAAWQPARAAPAAPTPSAKRTQRSPPPPAACLPLAGGSGAAPGAPAAGCGSGLNSPAKRSRLGSLPSPIDPRLCSDAHLLAPCSQGWAASQGGLPVATPPLQVVPLPLLGVGTPAGEAPPLAAALSASSSCGAASAASSRAGGFGRGTPEPLTTSASARWEHEYSAKVERAYPCHQVVELRALAAQQQAAAVAYAHASALAAAAAPDSGLWWAIRSLVKRSLSPDRP